MPLAKKPTVFVSSTCYDLKQIRADLKCFFEDQLGYEVLLSEYSTFPIDPNIGTTDNCLHIIDERADVFVLIVGCRYGNITESGHSVTNLEYLRARAKGIPIYAFVDKTILNLLPVWRENPNMSFSSTVDTPKLFEFVDTFRSSDGIWSFGFESAQSIIDTLRVQLGYLFSNSMALRQKATRKTISRKIQGLHGVAFQEAILGLPGWEYRLFAHILDDGLKMLADRKRDFNFGISLAPAKQLETLDEVIDYISLKIDQLSRAINVISTVVNRVIPEAFGPEGVSGDADSIIYAADRILSVYEMTIEWSLDFSSIATNDEYKGLVQSFTKMCGVTLNDIERFSKEYNELINRMSSYVSSDGQTEIWTITLKLNPPDAGDYFRELNKLLQKNGIPPVDYE